MTTLTAIVNGLEARLRTIPRLSVYDHVPGGIDPPAAVIMPPAIDYQQAMKHGAVRFDLEVQLYVGSFESDHQLHLFPYLDVTGDRSVVAAIEGDRSLGFDDVDVAVMSARPLALEEIAAYGYWGASFQLLVAYTNQG